MKIFKHAQFSILFGNAQTSAFTCDEFRSLIENNREILQNKIKAKVVFIKESFPINNLFFLRQVHGIDGEIIATNTKLEPLCKDGDYLITNVKNQAIGIFAGDCLPIVFFDAIQNVAAIAHAGWPGTVAGISTKVLNEMQTNFNSKINDIQIFFGPCAKICCYEVQQDFLNKIDLIIKEQTIIDRDSKTFFNLPLYNILMLEKIGINKKNIDLNYNFCTICNIEYCSYRRDKEKSGRQMTIITLY